MKIKFCTKCGKESSTVICSECAKLPAQYIVPLFCPYCGDGLQNRYAEKLLCERDGIHLTVTQWLEL